MREEIFSMRKRLSFPTDRGSIEGILFVGVKGQRENYDALHDFGRVVEVRVEVGGWK